MVTVRTDMPSTDMPMIEPVYEDIDAQPWDQKDRESRKRIQPNAINRTQEKFTE